MSEWNPNLICSKCGENYYTGRPEPFVHDRCTREHCTGTLKLHPDYIANIEQGWLDDGIALAELYANHHGHAL